MQASPVLAGCLLGTADSQPHSGEKRPCIDPRKRGPPALLQSAASTHTPASGGAHSRLSWPATPPGNIRRLKAKYPLCGSHTTCVCTHVQAYECHAVQSRLPQISGSLYICSHVCVCMYTREDVSVHLKLTTSNNAGCGG